MNYRSHDKYRAGDHMCYISNLRKMSRHYPEWGITKILDSIFAEIVQGWQRRTRGAA
jgi:CDP-paratose 2-epimerase